MAQPTTTGGLVQHYLRPTLPSVIVATICSLPLGMLAAVIGVLVGPCVQIISGPRDAVVELNVLIGPQLGPWISALFGTRTIQAMDLLEALPVWLVAVAALKAAFSLVHWFLWERAGERVALGLRADVVNRFLVLDPSQRKSDQARTMEAELSASITTDVRMLREYVVHYYGGLQRELIQVVFLTVTLVLLSPKLFALFALGLAPLGIVLARVGRKLRKRAAMALADSSILTEWLQQRLLGIETIKHYRTEAIESAKMRVLDQSLFERFLRAARVKARTSPLMEAGSSISLALVLIFALRQVATGEASGAVQLSFFSTLGLLTQSAGKLGRYLNTNREGAAATDRLAALLGFLGGATRLAIASLAPSSAAAARLAIESLTVRYPDAPRAALDHFSSTFDGGKVYCLVGPSGAGKSTVFNAILGLVTPSEGHLAFAGPSASRVAYMPQKVQLVPDSVAANVSYPEQNPDLTRVKEALARVGMASVVDALPQGTSTLLGEGGSGVSGGQAQRILLARLWYHRAPIVLVDEGTSALDPEVEQLVHSLLRDLAAAGAAVLTIAHRRSVAEAADEVLLLRDGKLVTRGSPATVLRQFQPS